MKLPPFLKTIQAISGRLLFIGHSLLTVGYAAVTLNNSKYWYLGLGCVLIVFEGLYTILKRNGDEMRVVCVSAVFYLLASVPSIWFLKLSQLDIISDALLGNTTAADNDTDVFNPLELAGISFPIRLDSDTWVEVIEQTMLLVLIVARWLMPKGNISRDELSQVLFVYIAVASDIMELFVLFEEEDVVETKMLSYIVLGVWTFSLFQFSLVLTTSYSMKKARLVGPAQFDKPAKRKECCGEPEICSLLVSLVMMDGPFLAIRLYVLIELDLITYNIIFFVCKNFLMVLLIFYRLGIVCRQHSKKGDHDTSIEIRPVLDGKKTDPYRNKDSPTNTTLNNKSTKDDLELTEPIDKPARKNQTGNGVNLNKGPENHATPDPQMTYDNSMDERLQTESMVSLVDSYFEEAFTEHDEKGKAKEMTSL